MAAQPNPVPSPAPEEWPEELANLRFAATNAAGPRRSSSGRRFRSGVPAQLAFRRPELLLCVSRTAGPARAARPAGRRGADDGRHHLLHRRQLRSQGLWRAHRNHCRRRQADVPGDCSGRGPPRNLHRVPPPRGRSRGELRAGDCRLLHRRDGLPPDRPRATAVECD